MGIRELFDGDTRKDEQYDYTFNDDLDLEIEDLEKFIVDRGLASESDEEFDQWVEEWEECELMCGDFDE